MVPVTAPPPATPFTSQVTAVFDAPVTVALKGWPAPARTLVEVGETDMLTVGGAPGSDPPDFAVLPVHAA
jgi:hypothetical protein